MDRLLTIPISHYCERARWALTRAEVPYVEEQHLQLFHYRATRRGGGGRTVPVLVTDRGTLSDSSDVVAYADDRAPDERKLYPRDAGRRIATLELEARFAGRLGVETRRVMYYHLLQWGRPGLQYNRGAAPWWQHSLLWLAFPWVGPFMGRRLNVSRATMDRGVARVEEDFDAVAERLSDGRPFLMGEEFTAADLTFACMSAGVTVPEHYGTPLPALTELPVEARRLFQKFRDHPAGQFALRMFAQQRA